MSTINQSIAKHISKNKPKRLVSLQLLQPKGSVHNLNSKTTKIGREKDSNSFKANSVYPFTGNSFNRFMTQPPCGASCLVTERKGFASKITRRKPGISKNRMYNSHTLLGGISTNPNGSTTDPACAAPF